MTAEVRELVRERADHRCEYCGLPDWLPPIEPFHVEHVVARQHLGSDDPDNLALACHRCNAFKGPNLAAKDPQSGSVVLLFHPREQAWEEHFELEGHYLRGRTPTGRATVALLQMNAPRRLERRAELVRRGKF